MAWTLLPLPAMAALAGAGGPVMPPGTATTDAAPTGAANAGTTPTGAADAGSAPAALRPAIRFSYNGRPVALTPPPYWEGSVVMAPLRPLFAAMGATINWDPSTGMVLAIRNGHTVAVKPGSARALVNGHEVTLPVPATIRDGITYLPISFAAGAFGSLVRQDPDGTVVVLDFSHLDLPEESPAYRLLTRVLAHQSPPGADLTAQIRLADAPGSQAPLGYGLESRLVGQVRGGEGRYRVDQVYQMGGMTLPLQAEWIRHPEATYLRTPATGGLVERPGAGLDQLGLPLGLDPERPWLSPLVGAISGLSLGEEVELEGEAYQELRITYDPGRLRAMLDGLAGEYGAGAVSLSVDSGESRLMVRLADGWVRRLSQRVSLTLYRVDPLGMPLASPLLLSLEAEWTPAAGPIDWLTPLPGPGASQEPAAPTGPTAPVGPSGPAAPTGPGTPTGPTDSTAPTGDLQRSGGSGVPRLPGRVGGLRIQPRFRGFASDLPPGV